MYSIVPQVISAVPPNIATVKYGDFVVDNGNELTPTQVHDKPTISWNAEDGAYYTLIMVDPDIPPQSGVKEVQHWIVVNIPGDRVSEGEELFEYVGSLTPPGTGIHKYIFLVYKQDKKLEKSQYADIQELDINSRLSYELKNLEKKLELTKPVAGNFFRAQYDDNVPKYRAGRLKRFEKKD